MVAVGTLAAQATDYTDKLLVLVNGEGSDQSATISVNEHDGVYDLKLKNFVLMNGDSPMPVGNVELTNIVPEQAGNAIFLRAAQNITVTEGDAEGVAFWMGPMLGELPVEIVAVLENGGLRALINLDLMSLMQQIVEVRFGDALVTGRGYHIPNGDFEAWHTSADIYVEPNAWHSFESASGMLAPLAGHHIDKSENGIGGSACARIFATSIFGIVANGTMTTGRMNAGSMVATDAVNNAYMDMSLTDVDGNGDPFYVPLTSRPDSLVLWVQFKQGTPSAAHPYATVSAAITDGTYYQDPEDKDYSNVVAKAKNAEIATTGGQWRRLSLPFVYTESNLTPKAIMVTVSTNADAGQGSADDEVLVDNISLVYNNRLSELNVVGFEADKFDYTQAGTPDLDNLVAQANGQGAYVLKSLESGDEGQRAVITVFAGDLLSRSVYTINYDGVFNGISELAAPSAEGTVSYQLDGRQARTLRHGQVYIVRQADGTIVKRLHQ